MDEQSDETRSYAFTRVTQTTAYARVSEKAP